MTKGLVISGMRRDERLRLENLKGAKQVTVDSETGVPSRKAPRFLFLIGATATTPVEVTIKIVVFLRICG